jgi:DNA-binding HxlR family transcriptional regulator
VEYQLTTLGRELVSRLSAISQFAVDREGEINEARRRYNDEAADFRRAMIMSA